MSDVPPTHRPSIAGVILAGGAATRLNGRDKALLQLGGRPLVAWAFDALRRQANPVAVNANGDPSRFAALACAVVPDAVAREPAEREGPARGIQAALRWARRETDAAWCLTAPVDMPFVPDGVALRLLKAARSESALSVYVCTARGSEPLAALWATHAYPLVEAMIGRGVLAVRNLHAGLGAAACRVEAPDWCWTNINTPGDLAAAEAQALVLPHAQEARA